LSSSGCSHQGDIVVEDGDIFGDGVNIAARLEGLAQPGGVCVSARVQEDVAGKIDLTFEDLGEQQLKNIARPVRVYVLRPETVAELPVAGMPMPVPRRRRSIVAPVLAAVVATIVISVFLRGIRRGHPLGHMSHHGARGTRWTPGHSQRVDPPG
jgi:hypothetical protein